MMQQIAPDLWYPVDFRKRLILMQPRQRGADVLIEAGVLPSADIESAALGFPQLPFDAALVCSIVAREPSQFVRLLELFDNARRRWSKQPGDGAALRRSIEKASASLIVKRSAYGAVYHLAPAAKAARKPPCRFIPIRGSTIAGSPIINSFVRRNRLVPRHGPELIEFIREKNAQGFTDTEIAGAYSRKQANGLKVDRHEITKRRKAMGLPWHASQSGNPSPRMLERIRRKTKDQLAAAGLKSLAELRTESLRNRVAILGWPPCCCYREAEILTLIWDHGPQTLEQIRGALGITKTMLNNGDCNSYTGSLIKKGLLMMIPKAVGSGNNKKALYLLPLNIERKKVNHGEDQQPQWEERVGAAGRDRETTPDDDRTRSPRYAAVDAADPRRADQLDQPRGSGSDHAETGVEGEEGQHLRRQIRIRSGTEDRITQGHDRYPEQLLRVEPQRAAG